MACFEHERCYNRCWFFVDPEEATFFYSPVPHWWTPLHTTRAWRTPRSCFLRSEHLTDTGGRRCRVGGAGVPGLLVLLCCVYGGLLDGYKICNFWARTGLLPSRPCWCSLSTLAYAMECSSDLGSLCVGLGRGVRFLLVRASGERVLHKRRKIASFPDRIPHFVLWAFPEAVSEDTRFSKFR